MRLGLAAALALQTAGPGPTDSVVPPPDGARLSVYLVTIGPGPLVWERFGHNAILIRDSATAESVAYDFGRFSFEQEHFFLEFARGRMLYWMGRENGVALLNFYIRMDRAVYLQELELSPAQRVALQESLETNYERDRGRYRYDYYRDNCSTRVRDALDAVLGGLIRTSLDSMPTATSYRWHTRRSLENNLLNYFAVDAGLGPPADLPITRLQETFLPGKLREYLRGLVVPGPDGKPRPLVRGEITVAEGGRWTVAEEPADLTLPYLAAGVGLGAVLLLLGRQGRRAAWARAGFGVVAGLWGLGAAAAGALLVFLAYFSEHLIAFRNENVLQFNLLAVALLPLLPGALRGEARRVRPALALAWLLAAGSVLGLVLKGLPGWGQANAEVIAFALPVHLGLAGGLQRALTSRATSADLPLPE